MNFEYVSANNFPDSGLPLAFGEVVAVDRRTNYQSALDSSDQNIYRFQADYQNQVSDRLTVRNKAYYRGLDWLSNGTLFNGVVPVFNEFFAPTGEFVLSRSLILLDDRQSWIGNQLEAVVHGNTGSVSHNLLLGFELGRQADEFTLDVGFLPDVPLFDPGPPTPGPPFLLPQFGQAGDSRAIIAAPYAIDQITFNDHFQVLAGVRLDTIDFTDELRGVSRRDTKASPMLGVVFVADENSTIYANYTRSFAPPAPRVQTGEVLPEEGEQIEAGFKREFLDRHGRATVAVYQLERLNIGIPDANGVTQQVGSQRSRGFETELFLRDFGWAPLRGLVCPQQRRAHRFQRTDHCRLRSGLLRADLRHHRSIGEPAGVRSRKHLQRLDQPVDRPRLRGRRRRTVRQRPVHRRGQRVRHRRRADVRRHGELRVPRSAPRAQHQEPHEPRVQPARLRRHAR